MEIGNLHPYNQKKLEEDIKAGKQTTIGIDAGSLYDEINLLEINTGYNMAAVIATLKSNLMAILGKAVIQEPAEGKEDNAKGGK